MRHKHRSTEGDEAEIDMTPMLDIVFIMLIFFIVTASFLKESGVEINRPDSSQKSENQEAESIFIDVTARDEVWINKRRVDVRAVRANVERLKAKMEKPSVVIKADRDSSSGRVIEVVEGVRTAGVYNYVVATPKKN
ncbi:ExbD/TolR family protein [Luteithermobacter gelatinilyticus]|uniref:ExbD/TolR family protein n=1 Tax=Luteithermobacter gelatinilyticus TaxID=2582913 RepID=UPI0011060B3C|nr:biopolymer transporter ExbD [Luteithermobacter gelatinilyticus]|tara:strand:+ start:27936 stop:28346 length:411 start_codon:yes stop_codon:yes gene_type:complete